MTIASVPAEEGNRGFTDGEIAGGISAPGKPIQILQGQVIDRLGVSTDGDWITYTVFSSDLRNNEVWIIFADGSGRRRIEAPHGYKNSPVIRAGGGRSPRVLYLSLAGSAKGDLADGIYLRSLEGRETRWELFMAGSYRDLALSQDGDYLAASSGNWNAARVRSTIAVFPLEASGQRKGPPRTMLPDPRGQVRSITFSPDSRTVFFECAVEDARFPWGRPHVYSAENKADSRARILVMDASSPAAAKAPRGVHLYFLRDANRVCSIDPGTDREVEVVGIRGLTPTCLAWDQRGERLLLGLQASSSVAGLLAIDLH